MKTQQSSIIDNRFDCHEFDDFPVTEARLDSVSVNEDIIEVGYLLDGQPVNCSFQYDSIRLDDPIWGEPKQIQGFAVAISVLSCLRFAAILPKHLDLSKYSEFIHQDLLDYLEAVIPGHWSEHRYQLGKVAYRSPDIKVNESKLGQNITYPLFAIDAKQAPVAAVVSSGSGKDSLLCCLILDKAGLSYDLVTCLHNIYGNLEEQKKLFSQSSKHLHHRKQHYLYTRDSYVGWLECRMEKTNIVARTQSYFHEPKRFRYEAGETLLSPFIFAPIQLFDNIPLLAVGNEKSSDTPNLYEQKSGEPIAHQWEKNLEANQAIAKLMAQMFSGITQTSITKPIHDVKIYDLLFHLGDELPYSTNSCNIQKPWCGRCEKCCYVFSGFCAYGEMNKVLKAFGNNLLEIEDNLPLWEQLLGLKKHIAWECVGLPEEAQLYFYKIYQKGVRNPGMDLFEREILHPLQSDEDQSVENYFQAIEDKLGQVYEHHHTMSDELWTKLQPILESRSSTHG